MLGWVWLKIREQIWVRDSWERESVQKEKRVEGLKARLSDDGLKTRPKNDHQSKQRPTQAKPKNEQSLSCRCWHFQSSSLCYCHHLCRCLSWAAEIGDRRAIKNVGQEKGREKREKERGSKFFLLKRRNKIIVYNKILYLALRTYYREVVYIQP